MTQTTQMQTRRLLAWTLGLFSLVAGIACDGCQSVAPVVDAGADAGVPGPDSGRPGSPDGGLPPPDGGVGSDADVPPACDQNTPGYGEPCSASGEQPFCGQFFCNPMTDELFCWDPDGPNACGVCGELDESEGRVGEACGEFGCGVAACGEDGTKTICEGDHPRNQCGGCADILPVTDEPGQTCSVCGTGTRTCSRDDDELICWQGRSPDTVCGGCERCVLFHAWMDERFGGGYIRSGTLAILEDIGSNARQLVFDPLIEGPGANALVYTQVLLSTTPDPLEGSYTFLSPSFAASTDGVLADPHRAFFLGGSNIANYNYVVLYDFFLRDVISAGALVSGPPPEMSVMPMADAGVTDAGTPEASVPDGGEVDAGVAHDGAGSDAGEYDAGTTSSSDASVSDGGSPDAGTTDAGT